MSLNVTQIYYETAPRLLKTLKSVHEVCPAREIVIARELTKTYEEVLKGQAGSLIKTLENRPGSVKGEIVLLIGPASDEALTGEDELTDVIKETLENYSVSETSKMVAAAHNMPRKKVYELALKISSGEAG